MIKIAISREAVDKYKTLFVKEKGYEISDKEALFDLGFDLDEGIAKKVVTYRLQASPMYITTGEVIEGRLRRQVLHMECDKIVYSNKPHKLYNLYLNNEVVSGDIIPEDKTYILDFGNEVS